jgi:hypothetical protein
MINKTRHDLNTDILVLMNTTKSNEIKIKKLVSNIQFIYMCVYLFKTYFKFKKTRLVDSFYYPVIKVFNNKLIPQTIIQSNESFFYYNTLFYYSL